MLEQRSASVGLVARHGAFERVLAQHIAGWADDAEALTARGLYRLARARALALVGRTSRLQLREIR